MGNDNTREDALKLLERRKTIVISGSIKPENADIINECLLVAYVKGYEELTILIDSPGGQALLGDAIYNGISICVAAGMKVRGLVISRCYSAASFLLQACSTREMMSNSTMVIHWGSHCIHNFDQAELMDYTEDGLELILRQVRGQNEASLSAFAERSGLSRGVLLQLLRSEEKLSPQRAKDLGLIDTILEPTALMLPDYMHL